MCSASAWNYSDDAFAALRLAPELTVGSTQVAELLPQQGYNEVTLWFP